MNKWVNKKQVACESLKRLLQTVTKTDLCVPTYLGARSLSFFHGKKQLEGAILTTSRGRSSQ